MYAGRMHRYPSTRGLAALVIGLLLLQGCSSFERDWKTIATGAAIEGRATTGAMNGRWAGTWESGGNHGGGLRCIITTDDEGVVRAHYKAEYGNIFRFEYTLPMVVTVDGETCHFTGEADLGFLAGGRYTYEGTVIGDAFTSSYDSRVYTGTFDMQRVPIGVLKLAPPTDDEPADDESTDD